MRRRLECVSRSIQHCQHPQLKERLFAEISCYQDRCFVMKDSLNMISHSLDCQSIQKSLLEELLSRCLSTVQLSCRII